MLSEKDKEDKFIEFYCYDGLNSDGLSFLEIVRSNDEFWDGGDALSHSFIQWLFPLPEKSMFNKDAPILTDNLKKRLMETIGFSNNYELAFFRFLDFLGFKRNYEGKIEELDFQKIANWAEPYNHNHLRITRVLKFLKIVNSGLAKPFLEALELIANDFPISEQSLGYWRRAVSGEADPPREPIWKVSDKNDVPESWHQFFGNTGSELDFDDSGYPMNNGSTNFYDHLPEPEDRDGTEQS